MTGPYIKGSYGTIWDNLSTKTVMVMNGETTENIRTHEFIPIIKRQIKRTKRSLDYSKMLSAD